MTLAHAITDVQLTTDGVRFTLFCPYAGYDLTEMPDFTVPVCRIESLGVCAAQVQLAEFGIGAVWQGPPATVLFGPILVTLWSDGELMRMAAAGEAAETVEKIAQRLAGASGSHRYDDPGSWRLLLTNDADVTYAFTHAEKRRGADQAALIRDHARLVEYHRGATRPGDTVR